MAAKIGSAGGSRFDLGQNADMNVTPFVDVMLVLLIIFMVVAPIATTSIRMDIPPATPPKNDNSKPPTYGGSPNRFTMFPGPAESKSAATVSGVPLPYAVAHPIAAITLTIVLALLVSVPICVFVTSGRAGDALFGWSQRMRGVADSPASPPQPAPSSSPAPELANPQQP